MEKKKSTRLNKYICSLALIIPPLPVDDDAVPLTKQEMLSPTDGGSDSVCRVNYNLFQHYPHCRKKPQWLSSITMEGKHVAGWYVRGNRRQQALIYYSKNISLWRCKRQGYKDGD